MKINVLIADDHALVRDGLCAILDREADDITVVGQAADGRDALAQARQKNPDVMLMDIAMPVMNGIGAAAQIRDLCPAVSVIMLSMHATSEHIYRSLQAGARGYLLKDSAGAELVEAVKRVHGGERYLARAISDTLIDGYLRDYCRNVKPGGDGRAASVDWRKR